MINNLLKDVYKPSAYKSVYTVQNKCVRLVDAKLGVITANGIVIKVLSKYQQERSDEHNRGTCEIIDALVNPLHIRNITDNDNGRLQRLLANQLL